MALFVEKTSSGYEYKLLKDLSQTNFGQVEINLAQLEMWRLRACRDEFGPTKPFSGVRISSSLHLTSQTVILIETLSALGAEVCWCSCNIFSTIDHTAAAIARGSATVSSQTLQEYWQCTEKCLDWGTRGGPDLIVDNGGDMTFLIHEGVRAEEEYEKTGKFPDPESSNNTEHKIILSMIREGLKVDPKKYIKIEERLAGVSNDTPTGVKRFYQIQHNDTLHFPVIDVNDSVTKFEFDSLHAYRYSIPEAIIEAARLHFGLVAVVCGYGNVGKGCAAAMSKAAVHTIVTEIDPICALQARSKGFQVSTLDDVVSEGKIFITATGNKDVITVDHMRRMKRGAIVCNIGRFDGEIDMKGLETYPGVKKITIEPQMDRWVFPDTGDYIIVLGEGRFANMDFSFQTSSDMSFTNLVIALLELWKERKSGKYANKVYGFPKHLDEKGAALCLDKLGCKLTKLTPAQSEFVNIPVEGPFKPSTYHY